MLEVSVLKMQLLWNSTFKPNFQKRDCSNVFRYFPISKYQVINLPFCPLHLHVIGATLFYVCVNNWIIVEKKKNCILFCFQMLDTSSVKWKRTSSKKCKILNNYRRLLCQKMEPNWIHNYKKAEVKKLRMTDIVSFLHLSRVSFCASSMK